MKGNVAMKAVLLRLACLLMMVGWGAGARAADVAPHRVNVVLDWFLNADHAALLAAQYSGSFARHGLEVHLIAPADPGAAPRMVAAGQADLAVSYQTQLGMLSEQGIPLVRVGTLIDTPLNALIAAGDIHSLADLKGKAIGISLAGADDAVLGTMLSTAGVAMSDIHQVNVNFQLEQALMSHSVDAVMGAVRTYELIDLKLKGMRVTAFYPEEHGVPLNDELVFLAARDHIRDPWVRAFMAALEEGTNTLLNHPDDILSHAIADHPELDTPLNRAAWTQTLPRVAKQPALLNARRYRAFTAFLHAHGVISHEAALETYAVDPFLLTP
ncbi:ABC transporter substrate-binding protein [Novacetimonas pomaceti]|uniref:ABC transporter substrate-binding protein n=1 Tax=Novacetimonas pomaceti TaxID=2021998 RepID=UPI0038CF34EE